ncbi:uncharacterized protein MELLADRAFT_108289 [Melampsora larici-populina 98AG31]|uniref:Uncharacterized protein n=1 Tax=Melampsora larici-populina (strain 98AG31 / pathotype 3-4-7) TaxID=747676 RepID=F4RSL1_MELLP|nr:uncharacterized protein MELLADRAFT_108289 [Melampsora larici-populina 98AG31]EGG04674.1 hypothetical protein MELLADRAFT_108289 [Melampsora larici-populina 98AG31]
MNMLVDFPIDTGGSVVEIVSDGVYAAQLDRQQYAKEFNTCQPAKVMERMGISKLSPTCANSHVSVTVKTTSDMADALEFQPAWKNDGLGFAVVEPKKKKK